MSKYNQYAKQLDEAFKAAREQYNKLNAEYEAAKKAHEDAKSDAERLRTQAALVDIRASMKTNDPWNVFDRKAAELRNELDADVRKHSMVNENEIDQNAVTLLESGLMDVDDFDGMADRFFDNATMRRLIAKYVKKARDECADRNERFEYIRIAQNLDNGRNAIMEAFDELVACAKKCSGDTYRGRGNRSFGYVNSMSDWWNNDETIRAAIAEF